MFEATIIARADYGISAMYGCHPQRTMREAFKAAYRAARFLNLSDKLALYVNGREYTLRA